MPAKTVTSPKQPKKPRGRHPGRQTERLVCAVTPEERNAVYGVASKRGLSVSELLFYMSVQQCVRQWAREQNLNT